MTILRRQQKDESLAPPTLHWPADPTW